MFIKVSLWFLYYVSNSNIWVLLEHYWLECTAESISNTGVNRRSIPMSYIYGNYEEIVEPE